MFNALIEYEFLRNAAVAGILSGIICGIIGVMITEKKLLMMSGGIAHTAYGGVGLGYLLGFNPMIGAGIFSVLSALLIGKITRKGIAKSDTVISLLWSFGMAAGIAFTGFMPGYPPDINSYLFGNILTVSHEDILIIIPLCLAVIIITVIFYNDWVAFMFDQHFALISGINTAFFEYLLLVMVALCTVVLIRVVGIVLVIALFSAPAACAGMITKKLKTRMITSVLFCISFCLIGLILSYYLGIASGATIVFVSVVTYFFMYIFKLISNRKNIQNG